MRLADPIVFKYNFHFENKEDIQFKIALDADTLNLITKPVKIQPAGPGWTMKSVAIVHWTAKIIQTVQSLTI